MYESFRVCLTPKPFYFDCRPALRGRTRGDLDADAGGAHLRGHLARVRRNRIRDRQDARLHRRQPQRERACPPPSNRFSAACVWNSAISHSHDSKFEPQQTRALCLHPTPRCACSTLVRQQQGCQKMVRTALQQSLHDAMPVRLAQ